MLIVIKLCETTQGYGSTVARFFKDYPWIFYKNSTTITNNKTPTTAEATATTTTTNTKNRTISKATTAATTKTTQHQPLLKTK